MAGSIDKRKLLLAAAAGAISISFFFGLFASAPIGASGASGAAGAVEISGVIEYKKIGLSFKNSGKIERMNVDEGFKVKKGEIIASLDTSDLEIQKKKAENALLYAESLKPQIEALIEFQKANHKSQLMLAEANISAAQARLDEALAGNREQQIEQARAALNKASIELEKLSKDYKRYLELSKSGSVTTQSLDTVKSQLLAAEQLKRSAEEQYNLLKEGARRETIAVMKAGVEQARAQLKGAEALAFQAKKAECDLESLKREIEVKKSDIDSIVNKLNDSLLTAPEDGIIIEKISETSEVVGSASSVAVLANLTDVWV
ncbi:MAG TPA: biotin/lipoyl-binding protein, partial [Candidatus Wallbacteria bacterium]|nr:biotin/lipoyl-binding protein [Candidatus Wallbacteria bacterium]